MNDVVSNLLEPRVLTHLERLEAESIQVMREVIAEIGRASCRERV